MSGMKSLTIHMPYECCCPHCPGYAREGYAQFKNHIKTHVVDDVWTCPVCQRRFEDLKRYMQHLEELEAFITKKKSKEQDEYWKFKDYLAKVERERERWRIQDECTEMETIRALYEESESN